MSSSSGTHTINVVFQQTGLDEVDAAVNKFHNSSGLATQSQDALSGAMGKTQGAAIKTGQEFSKTEQEIVNTGKAATTTSKQTMSLGEAVKGSALQIAAFASGLISTIGQLISYQKTSANLEKQDAALQARWLSLEQAQKKLDAQFKAGKISAEDYAIAQEKLDLKAQGLAKTAEVVEAKHQQHSLTLMNMATTAIPTVINAVGSLTTIYEKVKGVVDSARDSTDAATESTEGLGVAAEVSTTAGMIPLIARFKDWITGSKSATKETVMFSGSMKNVGTELQAVGGKGNIVVNAFKAMGTAVTGFGSSIKTNVAGATGIVDKIKTGFSSFFSLIGTGFKDFGTSIKNAITSLSQIRLASIAAFVTNPAFLAIAAIGAIIVALSGNMFGFRDALNGVGKALGDAVPLLKGMLTWLGESGNAALDAVGGFLGFQKQLDTTGESATQAAQRLGTLPVAIQNVLNTMSTEEIDAMIVSLQNMTTEINNLGTTGLVGIQNLGKQMAAFHAEIGEQSPVVEGHFKNFSAVLAEVAADGIITVAEIKKIVGARDELTDSLLAAVKVDENAVASQTGVTKSLTDMGDTVAATTKIIDDYESTMRMAEDEFKQFAIAYVTGNDQMIAELGLSEKKIGEYIERVKKEFPGGAVVVKQFGVDTVMSLDTIKENFGGTAKDITAFMGDITKAISPTLVNVLAEAELAVRDYNIEQEYLAEVSKIAAAGIIKDSEEWALAIEDLVKKYPELKLSSKGVMEEILKATADQQKEEAKLTKETDKSIDKVLEKAKALGIELEIADLSTKGKEVAIKTTEDEIKADNKAMTTLQTLAVQRGLNKSLLEQSSAAHLKYIANHDLETTTTDEVRSKLGELIAARQEDVKATDLETSAQTSLLTSMEKVPPVLDMTGKGLAGVVQAYDDTTNATGIAADSIGVWYAELDKTKAVHDATIVKLKELAEAEGITIPQAIMDQGIPAIKEYIENIKGVGDAAVKMKEDTLKAFEEMSGKGQDMMGELIDEAILEGDSKKIKEILDEIGLAADNAVAVQRILTVTVDDTSFQNDIAGLHQIMLEEFEKMTGFSAEQANEAVMMYSQEMVDEFGKQNPKMGDAINAVWEYVKANAPAGATGDFLLHAFGEAVKDPTIVTAALDGSLVIPTKNATTTATEAAGTGAASIPPAIADSIFGGASTIQNATLGGVVNPITGEIEKVPPNATTALAPVEGVFSAAFLAANVAATGQISLILKDIGISMGFLVTNIQEKLTEIETAWGTHGTNVAAKVGEINAAITTVQEAMSNLSSNIATYMDSMTTNIDNWASATGTSMDEVSTSANDTQGELSNMSSSVATYMDSMSSNVSDFESSFGTSMDSIITDAEEATTAVEDLQSAIDALKDKTITITVNLSGAGASHLQHGGSFINFGAPAHAQHGASWIQNKPTKIGGTSISETFPEVVSVIPLDPKEKASPFYNLELPVKTPQIETPSIMASGGGGGGPTVTQGDVYVTVQLPNGEALARVVKPFMLTGYSGITSS